MSDEWKAYKMLPKEYTHYVVAHGKGQYVDGNNYTNTLEGYWGLFKRNITGVYHYVSRKHLDRYCNEFDYKYNTKNDTIEDRFNKALSGCGEIRLKYKDLVE